MNILMVNNYYYHRGGDCTYFFALKKILEDRGHKVIVFAMNHPLNYASEYSKYFVSYINYDEEVKDINISSGLKVLKRTIYSNEARNKIDKLIAAERPDIIHIHNVHHHITPSIFYAIKKYDIPIIWTLHDYTMICPNTSFLSHGRICEKCKKNKYYWPSIEKCKKDSFSASTVAGCEAVIHKIMGIQDFISVFAASSDFLRNKFIEYGYPEDKVVRLDLCVDIQTSADTEGTSEGKEDYFMYVGRLSHEKGIYTLIDAAINVNSCKLKIVGSGPIMKELIEYARLKDKNNMVEFLGQKNRDELGELYSNAKFIVIPSEWYETAGLVIFEAFKFGKPVIGSRIGGITEFVKDTERGLVFEPGNKEDLSAAIRYLLNNPDLVAEMGENGKKYIEEVHSAETHYEQLMKIYKKVLSKVC